MVIVTVKLQKTHTSIIKVVYDFCAVFQVIYIHVTALCEEQNEIYIILLNMSLYAIQMCCINDTCMTMLHKCSA